MTKPVKPTENRKWQDSKEILFTFFLKLQDSDYHYRPILSVKIAKISLGCGLILSLVKISFSFVFGYGSVW